MISQRWLELEQQWRGEGDWVLYLGLRPKDGGNRLSGKSADRTSDVRLEVRLFSDGLLALPTTAANLPFPSPALHHHLATSDVDRDVGNRRLIAVSCGQTEPVAHRRTPIPSDRVSAGTPTPHTLFFSSQTPPTNS